MLFLDLLEVENPRKCHTDLKLHKKKLTIIAFVMLTPSKILGYFGSEKGSRRPLGGSPC